MKKITVQIDEALVESCRCNAQEFPESIIERALKEKIDSCCKNKQANTQTHTNVIGLTGKTLQGFINKLKSKIHV